MHVGYEPTGRMGKAGELESSVRGRNWLGMAQGEQDETRDPRKPG